MEEQGHHHQIHHSVFPLKESAYNSYTSESAQNYPPYHHHSVAFEASSFPHNYYYYKFLPENEHFKIQEEASSTDPCFISSFDVAGSSIDIDHQKARFLDILRENAPLDFTSIAENQTCFQAYIPKEDTPLLKTSSEAKREKAKAYNFRRNMRMGERLDALKELLPDNTVCRKAAVYDAVIDHIKHLQLQLNVLSRNRLGSESFSYPFVSLEEDRDNLEESLGNLMEDNPSVFKQLLERKGLVLMPTLFE